MPGLILSFLAATVIWPKEPVRPSIDWPVSHSYRQILAGRAVILEPVDAALPETRWNALLVYCDGKIEARDPRSGRSLWPQPMDCRLRPQLLGRAGGHYVFATPHRIFGVNPTTGRAAWEVGEEPPPDPTDDPENRVEWTFFAMNSSHVFAANNHRDFSAIDVESGGIVWTNRVDANAAGPMVANDRFVCFVDGSRKDRILVCRGRTGERVHAIALNEKAAVQSLLFTSRDALAVVQSKLIQVFELGGRLHRRWSAGTPGRFRGERGIVHRGGLYISDDGRTLTKYRADDGRRIWKSSTVGDARVDDEIWFEPVHESVLATRADGFLIMDAKSGDIKRFAENRCGFEPAVTTDSVVMLLPHPEYTESSTTRPVASASNYWMLTIQHTGDLKVFARGVPWNMFPLSFKSFGGFHLRDDAIILIDGNEMNVIVGR